jgi:phosphorylcholine metabolism protein LicD
MKVLRLDRIIENIIQFAKDAGKNKVLKRIMKPLWTPIRQRLDKMVSNNTLEQISSFHKKGLLVLKDFTDALDQININYTLAFGTMLGAVREHGFIKHDLDIDLMIWIEEYSEIIPERLKKAGFELVKNYTVDDRETGYEETYKRDGIGIDVFYLYTQDDGLPYCCDFLTFPDCASIEYSIKRHGGLMPRKLELPYTKERKKVIFENLELYIPDNAHEILRFRYGDDYMIPNTNWGISSYDNHISIMEGKVGIYKHF